MTQLLEKALELPISQRIELVEEIWDSIAAEPGSVDLSTEQLNELQRRLERSREDPNEGIPWESIKEKWLGRK